MSRCIVITSCQSSSLRDMITFADNDFIICADGGYDFAAAENIVPHVVIGDFDSCHGYINEHSEVLRVPAEKDDTDTMLCIKYGIEKGFDEFIILGGLGGRLDHTIANLQAMSFVVDSGCRIWTLDGKNMATMVAPGEVLISKREDFKLSLFAYTNECEGVTVNGVKYILKEATLKNNFPVGVSNEFVDDYATISISSGKLLIILSKD